MLIGKAATSPLHPPAAARAALLLVLAAFVWSALAPLHEMDLAQHLAMGEWIWRERAVPYAEPFAWTRAGQPYYAYSWLPEALFFGLLRYFGPVGLHLLEGLIAAGAVLAVLWAGRRSGLPPAVRLALAVFHLALLWAVGGTLRPQQFLFLTVPLAWGVAAGIGRDGPSTVRLLALAGVAALAANTHLFFPLTAVPLAYFAVTGGPAPPPRDGRAQAQNRRLAGRWRRWLPALGAMLAGWLLSPYGLAWPRVFVLFLGGGVLLERPPSIAEFRPGFEYATAHAGVLLVVGVLLLAPWLAGGRDRSGRERLADAACWLLGLLLFARAGRLVVVWWLLSPPLAGAAIARVGQATSALPRPRLARFAALAGGVVLLAVSAPAVVPASWRYEGGVVQRMLPRARRDPALWLPSWLLCHTRPGAGGRVFTEFNYGSELNWRLPGYSPSIDGRTIFPDSVAVDFSLRGAGRVRTRATTWQHADLALLDRTFWLAPVLDRDPDWLLLAEGRRTPGVGYGALWARREWWQRWGGTAAVPVLDIRVGDPRANCAANGEFPK